MSSLRPGRRTAAVLAILLLLAVAGSDLFIAGFWLSLMNAQLREKLAGQLGERLADGHQILGRWAVALTASETYAEIFDQHVELYGRVSGLLLFLREGHKQTDPRGFRNRAGGSTRRRAEKPRTSGSSTTCLGRST